MPLRRTIFCSFFREDAKKLFILVAGPISWEPGCPKQNFFFKGGKNSMGPLCLRGREARGEGDLSDQST